MLHKHFKKVFSRIKEGPSPFSKEFADLSKIDYKIPTPKNPKDALHENRKKRIEEDQQNIREITLFFSTVALGAKLAAIDGDVTKEEMDSFASMLPKNSRAQNEVEKLFGNACNDDTSFEYYTKRVKSYFPNQQQLYKDLLLSLFEFGEVDGPLNVAEINFLQSISRALSIKDEFFYQTLRERIIPSANNPFKVLGIKDSATGEEIKSAYRNLVQAYHPDRLGKIESPEIINIANERFTKIQHAYKMLMKLKS